MYDGVNGHMSFEVALDVLKQGGTVRRAAWPEHETITLDTAQGAFVDRNLHVNVELTCASITSNDWIEVIGPGINQGAKVAR